MCVDAVNFGDAVLIYNEEYFGAISICFVPFETNSQYASRISSCTYLYAVHTFILYIHRTVGVWGVCVCIVWACLCVITILWNIFYIKYLLFALRHATTEIHNILTLIYIVIASPTVCTSNFDNNVDHEKEFKICFYNCGPKRMRHKCTTKLQKRIYMYINTYLF